MYRCKNCRQNLKVQDSVIKEISHCTVKSTSELSVLYLDSDTCPRWIVQSFEQEQWRKGKLLCVKCKRKLGSFDFIQKRVCECLQHPVPVVHLLKDRIDEAEKRHDVYISGASIVPRHKQMTRPISSTHIPVINKGKETHASLATAIEDLSATSNLQTNKLPLEDQAGQHWIWEGPSNLDDALSEPNCDGPDNQENVPEQDVSLHGPDNNVPEMQHNADDNILDFPEVANVWDNRYAVLDTEELEETDDDSDIDTGYDGHKKKAKRRKHRENNVEEEEHDVEVDLTCCICLELYYSPHSCVPCKHTFCEECLRQVCKQMPTLTRCPLCRNVIRKCVFDKDLTKLIQEKHGSLYKLRSRGLRRKNKSYPLPGATRRQIMMGQHSSTAANSTLRWMILNSIREVYIRFACLLLLFVVHNILFKLDQVLGWEVYVPVTANLNTYLLKLSGKLVLFGIVYIIKKSLHIVCDHGIGYMVSFVFIFSVLLDGTSWLNSLLNLMVLGSLFL